MRVPFAVTNLHYKPARRGASERIVFLQPVEADEQAGVSVRGGIEIVTRDPLIADAYTLGQVVIVEIAEVDA